MSSQLVTDTAIVLEHYDGEGLSLERFYDERVVNEAVQLLKGFADATRLKILCLLREGEVCVHTIVDMMNISQSGVSHQLRILRDARLVVSRKKGRHVYYRLADEHVRQMLENALSHGEEAS